MIDSSARAAAKIYYNEGVPQDPGELKEIKFAFYASLAVVIEQLFIDMRSMSEQASGYGVLQSGFEIGEPWEQLVSDTLYTGMRSIENIADSPEYAKAQQLQSIVSSQREVTGIRLQDQLQAGLETGAVSMLTILRNLPSILDELSPPEVKVDMADAARRSVGLPWGIAMMSINQMMAAQATLSDNVLHEGWGAVDQQLNASYFELKNISNGSVRLQFSDLANLPIPEGYQPYTTVEPLPAGLPLHEIPTDGEPTIGCPITLVYHELHRLWNMYIDIIDSQQLWPDSN